MFSNHSSVRMGCSSSYSLKEEEDGRMVDAVLGDSSIGWIPPEEEMDDDSSLLFP